MKPKNTLVKKSDIKVQKTQNEVEKKLKFVANKTNEAIKAAESNPYTSKGKLKSKLKGAAATTNRLKEEGIEAHKRGIVPKPNMEGGLLNKQLNAAAVGGLKTLEVVENKNKIPVKINKKKLKSK